jgi:V8-like Glu-specific endopeptidase
MLTAVPVMLHSTLGRALRCRTAAGLVHPHLTRNPVDPKRRLPSSFGKGLTQQTVYPGYPAIFGRKQKMLLLKRSFLAISSLIAVAAGMHTPAQAQVAMFDPRDYGTANLVPRQSTADANTFIAGQSGGAFEPIGALRADDEIRRVARSIGRIDVVLREESGREVMATCTGTVLPHGFVLTNHHCIPVTGSQKPVRASILMNYLDQDGRESRRFDLSVTPTESNEKLDFSIVSVQGDISEFEGVPLSDAPVQPGQSLVVIHHPQGRPMVMTRFRCQASSEQPDQSALRHRCDTLPGSSGAMIFTSSLRGVALHFGGGLRPGDERSFNLSTRITALVGASPAIRASLGPASKDTAVSKDTAAAGDGEDLAEKHRVPAGRRPKSPAGDSSRLPQKPLTDDEGRMDPNDILKGAAPR